jgi:hypothetical protein
MPVSTAWDFCIRGGFLLEDKMMIKIDAKDLLLTNHELSEIERYIIQEVNYRRRDKPADDFCVETTFVFPLCYIHCLWEESNLDYSDVFAGVKIVIELVKKNIKYKISSVKTYFDSETKLTKITVRR